ncbi:AAA family ATPase [Nonomuraea sp. NPDC049421]|uniref:AAA family ATPase n=1 Tax=Nonomuraea sp. NPDC049421 TaxID=3155275 RepID=UPI0034446931
MFVGRTRELALLRGQLHAALAGAVRIVALEGPEGIGKTALIHEALRSSAPRGEAGAKGVSTPAVSGVEGVSTPVVSSAVSVSTLAVSGAEGERGLRLSVVRQLAYEAARVLGVGPLDAGAFEGGAALAALAGAGVVAPEDRFCAGRPRTSGSGRFGACAAGELLCAALSRVAERGCVVVVDDAQWGDRASLRALAYVLRHLRAGRVIVIVACRDISDPWLPEGLRRSLTGDSTLRLTLEGLTPDDLAALLTCSEGGASSGAVPERGGAAWTGAGHSLGRPHPQALLRDGHDRAVPGADLPLWNRSPERLGAGAVRRLWEHTLGNPLHVRELLGTLPHGVLDDPGARLPAPGTYRRGFERRLRACGPDAARLVAACAVLGGPTPLHVAASVAEPVAVGDVPLEAFEEAVAAGVLREAGGRLVDFPEPLARAAAYDGIGPATRARLHLAAAGVADDTGAALRHRAAAAFGPDGELAEELAGFAAKAAQHGLWREAAAHLDLAAGLTEPAGRRDELRTAVLEHVLIGGDVLHAARLAAARNTDPRPARRYVLGRLALAAGRFEAAYELLSEAWRHAEPGHTADVAEQLAWLHLVTGDPVEAAAWARRSIDQPIQSPAARPHDVLALTRALTCVASPEAGSAPDDGLAGAVALLRRGAVGAAGSVLRRVVGAAGTLAQHRLLATGLLAVADNEMARWDEAVAGAEDALAEATALGQRWLLPLLEVACVAPLAAKGEHERALAHATSAATTARGMRHALGERQAGLALASLGAGPLPEGECGDPGCGALFTPDPRPGRIEARAADGRLEEAERLLAVYERHAQARPGGTEQVPASAQRRAEDRPGTTGRGLAGGEGRVGAEVGRLRGLVLVAGNVPKEAEAEFLRALGMAAGVWPFEEGKVLLDLGRLLRRTGRRRAAAERLGAAREIFQRLGARSRAERCAHELEACGLEPPATVRLGLTPQELSTAMLVAGGLTNRQIARELLISVKTVEYHIGKIYTKLGIGSRVALTAELHAAGLGERRTGPPGQAADTLIDTA